uniref:Ycf36 n=1 Tax=Periphykon beckeri TaxID=2006982 RepID=A0A1Z1M3P1_9FLOR|nr:hypothetical protein [Periphykon beckeri]ARW60423.1 hypothetical protein [Periphykon beckeri]
MLGPKSKCPVPSNQQPFNEYLALKKSFLFSWSVSDKKSFMTGLLLIFILLFLFFGFFLFICVSFKHVFRLFLLNLFLSMIVTLLLLIRLYLGWSYVTKRLMSATVFYEESGWYDGQIWIKTPDYLIQDRLIGVYQVTPFVIRLKNLCLIIFFTFILLYLFIFMF